MAPVQHGIFCKGNKDLFKERIGIDLKLLKPGGDPGGQGAERGDKRVDALPARYRDPNFFIFLGKLQLFLECGDQVLLLPEERVTLLF